MPTAAIVAAAGLGVRLGAGVPKALHELCGEPLLVHAVRSLLACDELDQVVVAAPADAVDHTRRLLDECDVLDATRGRVGPERHTQLDVVAGGTTRRTSVRAALSALRPDVDVVLVHDAARPLVPAEMVRRVVTAVRAGADVVVPVLPVTDTVKRVADARVVETVDRTALVSVQTPQGFTRTALGRAHAETTTEATDDAGLAEEVGIPVVVVDGHDEAFKVTRSFDLTVAEAVLRARRG